VRKLFFWRRLRFCWRLCCSPIGSAAESCKKRSF